jgi:hypothetical protein
MPGSGCLAAFARQLSLGSFRSAAFARQLSLGSFRSAAFARQLSLPERLLRSGRYMAGRTVGEGLPVQRGTPK